MIEPFDVVHDKQKKRLQEMAYLKAKELEVEQLREQNRVLLEALRVAVFLDGPDTVQPEFERWSALVDEGLKQNFNEWYGVQVLAALTATRQPVKPQRRIHACDIPGCVSCGNPEDATSQEGQG